MCSQWSSKQRIRLNLPISALYPHFSVLSPFQRFIPISAFYPHFSVLSPFQRFIPISAFYPHFSVLSPFQRFIAISAFYPHFSFRFQFPFPRFSFSVLSLPLLWRSVNSSRIRYENRYAPMQSGIVKTGPK